MWTEKEAVNELLGSFSRSDNPAQKSFILVENETETWDHGWVLSFAPADGDGCRRRYVVDRRYNFCFPVGTFSLDTAIAMCVRRAKMIEENKISNPESAG